MVKRNARLFQKANKTKDSERNKDMKKQTIESAMSRLEEITAILESGEQDLDSSLKLYEEGVRLIDFCSKSLIEAKQRITKLSENV